MSKWDSDFDKRPVRTGISFGVSVMLGLVVITGVGGVAFGLLNLASQPARVVQRTFDADNMIYNYEWFRQQKADIEAIDVKVANAEASVAAAPQGDNFQDRQYRNQLTSILLGLRNQRASMVAAYNGNASKANRSIFLAGMPERIE